MAIEKIYDKLFKEFELYEIKFITDCLRGDEDNRTNKEILIEAIKDIVSEIVNYDDTDDLAHDWADSNTEIYTTEVFKIYSKNAYYSVFADDARQEFGTNDDIVKDLQAGIYLALRRFVEFVIQTYKELKEGGKDEDE